MAGCFFNDLSKLARDRAEEPVPCVNDLVRGILSALGGRIARRRRITRWRRIRLRQDRQSVRRQRLALSACASCAPLAERLLVCERFRPSTSRFAATTVARRAIGFGLASIASPEGRSVRRPDQHRAALTTNHLLRQMDLEISRHELRHCCAAPRRRRRIPEAALRTELGLNGFHGADLPPDWRFPVRAAWRRLTSRLAYSRLADDDDARRSCRGDWGVGGDGLSQQPRIGAGRDPYPQAN